MQERQIRVYRSRSKSSDPCIILQGKWLAELGFAAGDYLSITNPSDQQICIQIKEKFSDQELPKRKSNK